jgi:choline dehydrogenase-like flavoprotein
MAHNSFDYVIVGAGAAGGILANRLTADGTTTVALLEAGGKNPRPITMVPKAFFFTAYDPRTSKYFVKKFPTDHETWERGRMLGGSTEINGMVWNRGWAPDYDAIEEAGNPGWNWDAFVNAWKQIEDHELGASQVRGEGGPMHVSRAAGDQTTDRFIEAANANGLSTVQDLNGSDAERVGYTSSNIKNGLRQGADTVFISPAKHRKNLTILTHHDVDRVVIENGRAVGVVARVKGGSSVTIRANKEVLLAAGALDTPTILERSGIGNPDVLKAAGVEVAVASPKVGENLSEHRGVSLIYNTEGTMSYNSQLSSLPRQLVTGLKYLATRDGIISFGGYNALAYYKSSPDVERTDTFMMFTPISVDPAKTNAPTPAKTPGFMVSVFPLRPESRGSVHITSADPDVRPTIITNFLSTDGDRKVLADATRRGREILNTSPLGDHVTAEIVPGPEVTSEEAIVGFGLNYGASGYHTLGTASMGPDDDDVVDADLRVRGVEALRVVDASVFPHLTAGNNNAPTMAGAWIVADKIIAGH